MLQASRHHVQAQPSLEEAKETRSSCVLFVKIRKTLPNASRHNTPPFAVIVGNGSHAALALGSQETESETKACLDILLECVILGITSKDKGAKQRSWDIT